MSRRILAVSGLKGSGKDAMAEYLSEGYTRLSFADLLKEMTSKTYGVPLKHFHDQTLKEQPLFRFPVISEDGFSEMIHKSMIKEFRTASGKVAINLHQPCYWTPRALLILEGSVKRSVDSAYWLDALSDKMKDNRGGNFIVTDTRYCSEMEQLIDIFGDEVTTIRIDRWPFNPSDDPSENDLNEYEFDVRIANTGTIEEFHNNINQALGE